MYFSIDKIQPKVEEYVSFYNIDKERANQIFTEIYPDLKRVVHGVIFTHKYDKFDNVQDLESVAMDALISPSGLCKFNAEYSNFKGRKENLLFSFISLIAKRSIMFHTIKEKKYRNTYSIFQANENGEEVIIEKPVNDDYFNYISFIEESDTYIRPKFKGTRFYQCYDYLFKYLKINGRFDKRDFFRMVLKMLNTEEDVIPRVKTRLDQTNTLSRARSITRKTVQSYKYYLAEYLKETDYGPIKSKKSIKQI